MLWSCPTIKPGLKPIPLRAPAGGAAVLALVATAVAGHEGAAVGARGIPSAVSIFAPEAAILEHHFVAVNVVAEAPAAKSEPILTLTLRGPRQFLDGMRKRSVVRITAENFTDST